MPLQLDTEITYVKGVGPKISKLYSKLGIYTVYDLLFLFPRRYEDRTHLPRVADVKPGEFVTLKGRIAGTYIHQIRGGMKIIQAVLHDGSGGIVLSWFNQPWILAKLEKFKGELLIYGQVKEGHKGLEISTPEWEVISDETLESDFARIIPIYPLTDGLTQKQVRTHVRFALDQCLNLVDEVLPAAIRSAEGLSDLQWSLQQIHWPDTELDRRKARERLVFDEFFRVQLAVQLRREANGEQQGISIEIPAGYLEGLKEYLPFELTNAQKRVLGEIWSDMARSVPMNRLIQGDVGAGKTIVAACSVLPAIQQGYQACLMAPTEILAEQHYSNLKRFFEPLGIQVEFLASKLRVAQKRRVLDYIQTGVAKLCVGTHALIQSDVVFKNLGLVVIDEQHRFGVLQRAALREKSHLQPDVLVMTATPIPRTLTMTLYGDLDLSVIDELPPGRKPIKTHWKLGYERPRVYETVRHMVDQGRQAYFVCPMIEESEKLQAKAAEELYQVLSEEYFVGYRVGLIHGQLKSEDKEFVMEQFRNGEIQIMVSTVVIEVGVDVPNASVMVIEDAYRFGLSQLHQLRGRVGRGEHQSFCILVSDARTDEARERMQIMVRTCDGFEIAEADLRLRGPGELAGTRQSGNLDFKMADLVQDGQMLEVARQAAMRVLRDAPGLKKYPSLYLWCQKDCEMDELIRRS